MYWYKTLLRTACLIATPLLVCTLNACQPAPIATKQAVAFFDIGNYFKTEASKLASSHVAVNKMVSHNGQTQVKMVQIANWERELRLFIQSDINKPAWRDKYRTTYHGDTTLYHTTDKALHTQAISIVFKNKSVQCIFIKNQTSNALYQTTEDLVYQAGKSYQINLQQKVILLGTNYYAIKGSF